MLSPLTAAMSSGPGRVRRGPPLAAPGTSRAPGLRTGSPWSVCDSTGCPRRRRPATSRGPRPTASPGRGFRQVVRIAQHLREHPLVDHVFVVRGRWDRALGSAGRGPANPAGGRRRLGRGVRRHRRRGGPGSPRHGRRSRGLRRAPARCGAPAGPSLVLPPGRGQLTALAVARRLSAAGPGTSVMPLEPGVRRGNNVTGGPDPSDAVRGCAAGTFG